MNKLNNIQAIPLLIRFTCMRICYQKMYWNDGECFVACSWLRNHRRNDKIISPETFLRNYHEFISLTHLKNQLAIPIVFCKCLPFFLNNNSNTKVACLPDFCLSLVIHCSSCDLFLGHLKFFNAPHTSFS